MEVLLIMRDDNVTLPKFEKAVQAAVYTMWARFYWTRASFIHPDKGVPPSLSA